MRNLGDLFAALANSEFRSRFELSAREQAYLGDRSLPVILGHARDFVVQRLAPRDVANDGRQTPMRGHPAFVAQHATATCCRKCLAKWHQIPADRALTEDEIEHIIRVIGYWLSHQDSLAPDRPSHQLRLFPPA